MSEIARLNGTAALAGERRHNPFRGLPVEWRKPVGFFCLFHSDLLKGEDGVTTRLRFWIKEDSLTLEEATLVMRRLMRPDVCAKLTYAGQLLAELAVHVEAVVKDRRTREKEARFKAESEAARRGTAPREEFRRLVEGFGLEAKRWREE